MTIHLRSSTTRSIRCPSCRPTVFARGHTLMSGNSSEDLVRRIAESRVRDVREREDDAFWQLHYAVKVTPRQATSKWSDPQTWRHDMNSAKATSRRAGKSVKGVRA